MICVAVGQKERFHGCDSILLQVVDNSVHTPGSIYGSYNERDGPTKYDGRFQNDIDQYECVR